MKWIELYGKHHALVACTLFKCFWLLGIVRPALAQESVYNAFLEGARKSRDEAESLIKQGLKLAKEPLFAAQGNALMGNLYRYSARPAEVLPYCRKAVALREANQPATAWELGQSLRDLADCYRDMGKLDDAAPIYSKAISIVEKQPDRKYHLAFAISGLSELRLAQDNLAGSDD